MVDGELLFFFAQLFPDTLRLGDVLFGELHDVVVVVPEEAELFVAGFFFLLFAGVECEGIRPALVVDDADVQEGGGVVRNDFDDSFSIQLLYETVGLACRPVENDAPATITVQAFASFAHNSVVPVVGVFCFRIVDFYKKFQESFYFSFTVLATCKLFYQ